MDMRYSQAFFALQFRFAERIAARFSLPLTDALWQYTTFASSLQAENDWGSFTQRLTQAADPLEETYHFYLERHAYERAPEPTDPHFRDHPLFGCFYFALSEETIIHTHFLNNDLPGMRPLGHERAVVRRDELRRMFRFIRQTIPAATTVRGHSWLYNLPAYTRLFPPSYTQQLVENPDGVLQHVVLWYQCYDRFWEIKPEIAAELLRRVDQLTDLADLRLCFPYQRLRALAPIADFYAFYGISE